MTATVALLLGSSIAMVGCAIEAGPSEEATAISAEELSLCGEDSRSSVTTLTYPMGAIGRILRSEGGWCTASVIGPNKILTAQHCLSASATGVTFQPQWGISVEGAGPASLTSTRLVPGRDDTSGGPGDWAIVTLSGDLRNVLGANYQTLSRTPGNPAQSGAIGHVGYHGDGYVERPGRQSCTYTLNAGGASDPSLNLVCDIEGGSSGGPAYRLLNASSGVIVGVTAGHGAPDCNPPATGANGVWFAYAPDNPGGVAAAYLPDGRAELFATDKDWPQVLRKAQVSAAAGSGWEPWKASQTSFSGGRKISVINLQDGRRQMVVVMSNGTARTRWENSAGGSWTAWGDITLPSTIKDVASSGGSGLATHLYFLTTGNTVYRMYKLGDANSGWSNPVNMGTIPGATALAASYAFGSHRLIVSDGSGVVSSDGAGASFSGFVRRGGSMAGGLTSVSAGTLADGRLHILGSTSGGGIRDIFRSSAGAWTTWTSRPIPVPPRAGGFHTMTSVKLPSSNGQQIIAISNDGNLYTIWETGGGGFTTAWVRAYQ
jgi:V8-like Glu-specific endopeptidase